MILQHELYKLGARKMVCYRLIVSGRVQGVFYRYGCREKAEELGVKGYVRNLTDENVEVVAQGTEENVRQLIQWCHKGSSRADVQDVIIKKITCLEECGGFEICY